MLSLSPGQHWQVAYAFFGPDQSLNILGQKAQMELMARNYPLPQNGVTIFSDGLVKELTDFMNAHLIWREGDWKVIISCTVGSKVFSREFGFHLSHAQVESMKAVSRYYPFGIGVHQAARLPQMPDASASATVQIQEQ